MTAGLQPTSKAAYLSVQDHLNQMEMRVLRVIERSGLEGCTDEDLSDATGLVRQTICGTRFELVEVGLIVDSGRKRPLRSNRNAIVWVRSNQPGMSARKVKPKKPTVAQTKAARQELLKLYKDAGEWPSDDVIRLMEWVKYTVGRSAK